MAAGALPHGARSGNEKSDFLPVQIIYVGLQDFHPNRSDWYSEELCRGFER